MTHKNWLPNPKLTPVYAYNKFDWKHCWMWELLEDYEFSVWERDFTIPKWFLTDWASIPKYLRFFACPMDVPALKWVLIHDFFYQTWLVTKEEADKIFYLILIIVDVWEIKSKIYYKWVQYWWKLVRNKYRKINKSL